MPFRMLVSLFVLWSLVLAGCGQQAAAQGPEPATVGKYGYVGGIHASTRDREGEVPIRGTDMPDLYRAMKTGPGKYVVEVPDGDYEVRLHFIQAIREGKVDPRIPIDILIEGKPVAKDLLVSDLRQDKAESFQALVKTYQANVTDGKLDVELPWNGPPRHGLCGVEVIGEELAFRVNAGGFELTDPSGNKWRRDELYPIPTDVSVDVPVVKQKRTWVRISDGFKEAMAEAGVYPLMRWHINWTPNPGIMCVFADRAGNTFVNVAGNGLWRYEPEAGRLSRADGGKYTSLVGYRKLNDGNANDDGYIQVLVNPNGQGFYLVSWCCVTQPTDQIYSPDGKTFLNYTTTDRQTWDWGTADISQMPTDYLFNEQHHRQGKAYYSTDGGKTWTVAVEDGRRLRALGIVGPTTLIKALVPHLDRQGKPVDAEADAKLTGIHVSRDLGKTWKRVSDIEVTDYRGPILVYKDKAYVPSGRGLIVGTDNLTQWKVMPGSPAMRQQILFGADDNHIMAVSAEGFHETRDGGKTWTLAVPAPPATDTFFWDARRDIFYAGDYNGMWMRYNR